MEIKCECGNFRANLRAFPENTPGRLVCYCDDCQAYLQHIDRIDLLDENGGTEVIPAYPADVDIVCGLEHLKCTQLSAKGILRFSTSCCNTPIVNTKVGEPWAGFLRCSYGFQNTQELDQKLGPVRSRIMGKYAKGNPPAGTPKKFNLRAFLTVIPFMLKGRIFGKSKPSPFFEPDGLTPVVIPQIVK